MSPDELKKLDAEIEVRRGEREQIVLDIEQKRLRARRLSEEIRQLESQLPPGPKRNAIRMSVQPAVVAVKPRR